MDLAHYMHDFECFALGWMVALIVFVVFKKQNKKTFTKL